MITKGDDIKIIDEDTVIITIKVHKRWGELLEILVDMDKGQYIGNEQKSEIEAEFDEINSLIDIDDMEITLKGDKTGLISTISVPNISPRNIKPELLEKLLESANNENYYQELRKEIRKLNDYQDQA
ncbi:MAG: hypothetical protein H6Q60_11 [Oscillospiraceae bacterium]|nr:hypothetical protein [Oscillospiraceae bacterium]